MLDWVTLECKQTVLSWKANPAWLLTFLGDHSNRLLNCVLDNCFHNQPRLLFSKEKMKMKVLSN